MSGSVGTAGRRAFFALQRVDNVAGRATIATNKVYLRVLMGIVGEVDFPNVELSKFAAKTATDLGWFGARKTELVLGFAYRLRTQLPLLRRLALTTGCVGLEWACAIERGLQDVPTTVSLQVLENLDRFLVNMFTPTRENQTLPPPRRVQRRIEECLIRAAVINGAAKPALPPPEIMVYPSPTVPGRIVFNAELDELVAVEFEAAIETHARARKLTKTQALVDLVCGDETTRAKHRKVVIFGVGSFQPNVPLHIDRLRVTATLTDEQRQIIAAMQPEYRNALEVAQECYAEHDPTPEQRSLVYLRDGHCMFPDCAINADNCDVDHVINHEAGGWTTGSNLQSLCRHHHNMKTDRRVAATGSIDGTITWTDPETDEIIGVVTPDGPLAGIQGGIEGITTRHSGKTPADDNTDPPEHDGRGNWGYTWSHKNTRTRNHRDQQRPTPPPDNEPPPF